MFSTSDEYETALIPNGARRVATLHRAADAAAGVRGCALMVAAQCCSWLNCRWSRDAGARGAFFLATVWVRDLGILNQRPQPMITEIAQIDVKPAPRRTSKPRSPRRARYSCVPRAARV